MVKLDDESLGLGRPSSTSVNHSHLSPGAAARQRSGRHPREASGGVFQLFNPQQIKQFKEAFSLIDADGDGKITEEDLRVTMGNLGQTPSTSLLQTLLTPPSGSAPSGSQPRSINFAQFLTLFGQKLLELDTEQEILDAFACFDEDDDGLIDVPRNKGRMMGQEEELDRVGEPAGLRGWLKEYGDRMTDKEIDRLLVGPYSDKQERFDYVKFAKALKVNDAEDVERLEKEKSEAD